MATPNGLDPTFYSVNIAGGRLRQDKKGSAERSLQLHNHINSCDLSNEFKGEFINTTGEVIGSANYWSYQPTGLTGTPVGVSASVNVVAIAPLHTVTTGNIYALSGQAQIYGTLNGGTVNVAGVIGIVSGDGATTEVLHMTGVQSAISAGVVNPTTGTLSHYLANSTGTTAIDNLICMQDSQYIENFASFNAAATDKCVEVNTTAITLTETAYAIRVLIAGTPYYIPCFDSKTWA